MGTRQNRLAEEVLTSTHNVCFGLKMTKLCISLQTPVFYIKVGFKGVYISYICFPDVQLIEFYYTTRSLIGITFDSLMRYRNNFKMKKDTGHDAENDSY